MSDKESKDLAYWERNMLALRFAQGWYNDDMWLEHGATQAVEFDPERTSLGGGLVPRFDGWRRVLTLLDGSMTFHIPDDFDVGNLPQVGRNWDGHTTIGKWNAVARFRGIEVEAVS